MIPKIIHYCWFGVHPKPQQVQEYIDSWKEKLPEYRFYEWNEDNFDIENSIPFVKQAYAAKKYAFVSDYARLCVLAREGGIYLDTDAVIIKDFTELLDKGSLILGYEEKHSICMGFIATEPHHPIIEEFRDSYLDKSFLLPNGEPDLTPINEGIVALLRSHEIDVTERNHTEQPGMVFYTSDYFSGQDLDHGHTNMTENTYVFQENFGSWEDMGKGLAKVKAILKYKIIRPAAHKLLGYRTADKLQDFFTRKQRS